MAGPDSVPRLVHLLNHHDAQIRTNVAVSLKRLTGQDLGINSSIWATPAYGPAAEQWRQGLARQQETIAQ